MAARKRRVQRPRGTKGSGQPRPQESLTTDDGSEVSQPPRNPVEDERAAEEIAGRDHPLR
jgi:hypothetical protein